MYIPIDLPGDKLRVKLNLKLKYHKEKGNEEKEWPDLTLDRANEHKSREEKEKGNARIVVIFLILSLAISPHFTLFPITIRCCLLLLLLSFLEARALF